MQIFEQLFSSQILEYSTHTLVILLATKALRFFPDVSTKESALILLHGIKIIF